MPRQRVPLSVLAAALSACVVEPELLNSERIESEFGSYGIDVLGFTDGVRQSSLYSGSGEDKICRTYAVVRFDDVPGSVIGTEHERILAGGSIGATFKENGWQVYKETRYVGSLVIPDSAETIPGLMRMATGSELAMHVYRLLLLKESQTLEYATIVEVHHPEYLDRDALERLYIVDTPARMTERELTEMSELVLREP